MGQQYPHPKRREKDMLASNHSFGPRALFLLFYDNRDTEYESQEIEIDVTGPISTHKDIKVSIGK